MPKNQKKRKGRRPSKRHSSKSADPSFTHTLAYTWQLGVTTPTNAAIATVTYFQLSGFPQLASFFGMAQPVSYRMRASYINWSGTLAFVPLNPLSSSVPSGIGFIDAGGLMETRGSVRVQAGATNTGSWSTFPFAQLGLSSFDMFNVPYNVGYLVAYNDASAVTANWNIQLTLEVKVRFYRRTLQNFSVSPTLSTTWVHPVDEEEKSVEILTKKE